MQFEFNLYSSLLLIGFVQGIVFSLLVLIRYVRERKISDFFLGALLLVCCCRISQYMLGFAGWYDSHDGYTSFMFYFPFHLLLWVGPLIYFYFLSISNQQFQWQKRHFWHFLPGLIYAGILLTSFAVDILAYDWIMGQELPYFHSTKGFFRAAWERWFQFYYQTASIFHILIYLLLSLRHFRQYQIYLREHFADMEHISMHWLAYMLYAILASMGVVLLISFYSNFVEDLSYSQYWVSHFVLAVMIYVVSIMGYRQSERLHPQLAFEPENVPQAVSTTTPAEEEWDDLLHWKHKLSQLLDEEQVYLQPQLSLSELANRLDTNTSVLSKVINHGFAMNFNDLINQKRVEAVKAKMGDPRYAHLTLVGIGLECGFNSKATFNRAFRKFTDCSPREYLQQLNSLSR